jgi:hypothetical protein
MDGRYSMTPEDRLQKIKGVMANNKLTSLVEKHGEQVDNLTRKTIKRGEVIEEMLVDADRVEVGNCSFHDASIKIEKVNILCKIYLECLKILQKVDYRETSVKTTICGVAMIITLRIFTFR